jgi:antitoxin component YwqK of YwqJK toxin-antitoxin module
VKQIFFLLFLASCTYQASQNEPQLVSIQVQDRNGITETINVEEKLSQYTYVDFLSPQPYRKVTRVYRSFGKQEAFITTYHPNGQPKQYLEAKEMRANGIFREWHPNGKLKIEAQVISGTADLGAAPPGDWLFDTLARAWNDQGILLAEISYEKGLLEGPSKTFSEHGSLKTSTSYSKGQKNGEALTYYSGGKIASKELFKENLLQEASYFSPTDTPLSTVTNGFGIQIIFEGDRILEKNEIQNGIIEGKIECFDPSGHLASIYELKGGKRQGEEILYYPASKKPKLSISWIDDQISGTIKTWYEDQNIESQREYASNEKNGPSISWYRDGSLMLVEEYEKGKLTSGKYYKKGKKEPISTVINGSGTATLFDEWGRFPKKIRYTKGIPSEPDDS